MRYLITTLLSFFTFASFAQSATRFQDALQRADKEGKLVFVQYDSDECKQCNEVADQGLSDKELRATLKDAFVYLKIAPGHPDRAQVGIQYNIAKGFGILFIDHRGTLVHRFGQSSTRAQEYKAQMDMALTKAGESLKVTALEDEYKNGNKSVGFLEVLLLKKQTLNLPTDSLLEEYVQLLPADSLQSRRTLRFIAKLSPVLGSRADKALHRNNDAFNMAWYSMELPERVRINNMIIYKSLKKAVAEKNEQFAYRTAAFSRAINSNPQSGAKSFEATMLRYYDETKDTTNYFKSALPYYDRYYMQVNVDSVKRVDSLNRMRMMAQAPRRDTVKDGKKVQYAMVSYRPIMQRFTSDLNEGALKIYKTTSNPRLLSAATDWIKKGLEFFETPEALDTYSRLLYKQGQQQQAVAVQTQSIALRKERGFVPKEYEAILEKMKGGAALPE